MLFNSLGFLLFFTLVTAIYYIVPPKFRTWLLLPAGLVFYAFFTPLHLLILFAITTISYVVGLLVHKGVEREKKPKFLLAIGIVSNFSFLFTYKYLGFFTATLNGLFQMVNLPVIEASFDLALPVGISYFSFKAVSYMVDAYQGKIVEKNFLRYLLYVSFFPQVVAGPIERSTNLIPELKKEHRFDRDNVENGLYLMLFGLFKKMVVSDNLLGVVTKVFAAPEMYSGPVLAGVACVYSIQILCDFSGYSDIAIGCAKVLGIQTAPNFNHPFFSTSIGELWRRWHISLSFWLRDYLYIPLGGNRKGEVRKYFNLMIVFLVCGLWHGASWNFVLWGFVSALYQIVGAVTKPWRDRVNAAIHLDRHERLHRSIQIVITFLLFSFAVIFVGNPSVLDGFHYIKCMVTNSGNLLSFMGILSEIKLVFSVETVMISFFVALVSFAVYGFIDYKKDVYTRIKDKPTGWKVVFYACFIVFVVMFASTTATDFMYIRF